MSKAFCPMCGQPCDSDDGFCQSCGARLQDQALNSKPVQRKKSKSVKWIVIIALIIIVAAGSVTAYSMLGNRYTVDSVIHNTLALESGNIGLSVKLESDSYDEDFDADIEFLKNKSEKTILFDSDYETFYASASGGRLTLIENGSKDTFDYEDKLGLNTDNLENDLADFFVEAFKGQAVPDDCIEDLEVEKSDGMIIITGDVSDEQELLDWMYGCLDEDELKDLVKKNHDSESDDADLVQEEWEDMIDMLDDTISEAINEVGDAEENYDLDSSFEFIIDNKGILDQATINIHISSTEYEESYDVTAELELTDKNDIEKIKKPDFD